MASVKGAICAIRMRAYLQVSKGRFSVQIRAEWLRAVMRDSIYAARAGFCREELEAGAGLSSISRPSASSNISSLTTLHRTPLVPGVFKILLHI
jgi:hypothetical protein